MRIALILLLPLLGACQAPLPRWDAPPSRSAPDIDRQQKLLALDRWSLSGKASLQTPQETATLTFTWMHQPDGWRLSGNGSFGRGAFRAEQDVSGATLLRAGEPALHGDTIEQLLAETSSSDLPLDALRYWIKGLPAPGKVDTSIYAEGRLTFLEQYGWIITYQEYQAWGDYQLPKKLFAQGPEAELRLVIHRWNPE